MILEILRYTVYLQFCTQKLRLLTKFACNITVLNTLQCPPPATVAWLHHSIVVAYNGAVWVLPVYMKDLGPITSSIFNPGVELGTVDRVVQPEV